MKRKITLLIAVASLLLISSGSFAQNHYVVQSPDGDPHFLTFDISNGTLIDSVGVQFTNVQGVAINGFNGMAKDPISGSIFVALKDDMNDRHLGTIDPTTGDVTSIGILNFNASSITFDAAGTCYGMSGAGGTELHVINTTDATSTVFHNFSSAGDDGESICVNTTDGLMYRYDGGADGTLLTLNLTTLVETTVLTLTGMDTWGGGLYYNSGSNNFTLAQGETFYTLETNGSFTVLSDITSLLFNGNFKGIVAVNSLGIDEVNSSEATIYPNPTTSGVFTVEIVGNIEEIILVDALGRFVDVSTDISTGSVNGSTLAPGKYTVKVLTSTSVYTKGLVILK